METVANDPKSLFTREMYWKSEDFLHLARALMHSYEFVLTPLARQFKLPLVATDILLTLALHPYVETAADIADVRFYKANLLSMHIDRLVEQGYLRRERSEKDRRKLLLRLTDKADPLISAGRSRTEYFRYLLLQDMEENDFYHFKRVAKQLGYNLMAIKRQI